MHSCDYIYIQKTDSVFSISTSFAFGHHIVAPSALKMKRKNWFRHINGIIMFFNQFIIYLDKGWTVERMWIRFHSETGVIELPNQPSGCKANSIFNSTYLEKAMINVWHRLIRHNFYCRPINYHCLPHKHHACMNSTKLYTHRQTNLHRSMYRIETEAEIEIIQPSSHPQSCKCRVHDYYFGSAYSTYLTWVRAMWAGEKWRVKSRQMVRDEQC